MKKFTISILSILFSITMVYSQQDTLIYKYRRLAVDYQQSVKMAQRDLAGAESMLDAAKSDFLPRLDFYGGYNYLGVPIQMASSTEGQTGAELQNLYSLDLVISQPIITGGYLKNTRKAAQSQAEVMRNCVNLS